MAMLKKALVALVALQHLGFFVLEAFLWTSEFGRNTFHTTPEFAEASKTLAANQGVYNVFLASALIAGLVARNPAVSRALTLFGLVCVVVAGVVGGITADPQIVLVQGAPALVALIVNLVVRDSSSPLSPRQGP